VFFLVEQELNSANSATVITKANRTLIVQ